MKLFTELPMEEINRFEQLKGAEINQAKIVLANEVTKLCRSKEAADKISVSSSNVFNKKESDETLPFVNIDDYQISLIDALRILNFVETNGEARRLIRGNGAKINDNVITDENYLLKMEDYLNNSVKISSGKKKHGLLKLS